MDPVITLTDLFTSDPETKAEARAAMRGWIAAGGWVPTSGDVYCMCLRREVNVPQDWQSVLATYGCR